MKYFAPLSSYTPKHDKMKNGLDFIKIGNYAVININNMFPVHIPQELRIRSRGTERHSASN